MNMVPTKATAGKATTTFTFPVGRRDARVRMRGELAAKIQQMASRNGVYGADLVAVALVEYLRRHAA